MTAALRPLLYVSLLLLTLTSWADVTIRPNDKPKQTAKDFAKDQKKNGFPAPEASDTSAQYITGKSVDIELKASTSYLGSLKFIIRDQPKHGKLSEIRPSPSGETNRAMVTYTHNGDTEQLADQFTFAARIGEGTASAPGMVILSGRRPMAKLAILAQPAFKGLQPMEQGTGAFVVTNYGNAPFSSDLVWPAPFIGPSHLDLAVNEKISVTLAAKPTAPGAYPLAMELQQGVTASKVSSVVECAQAFFVTPGAVVLTYDPVSGTRKGTVKASNGSDSALTLKVDSGTRAQVVKDIYMGPHESKEVEIVLPKNDVAIFRGEVLFSQEPSRQKVLVSSEPKPPLIRLVSPAEPKLDFGSVTKGNKPEMKVTVINDGGVPAVLEANQVPPFLMPKNLSSLKAEPGKPEEITVTFAPELPGTFSQTIVIGGNGGQIAITARGTMTDPSRPAMGTGAAAQGPKPVRPTLVDPTAPPANKGGETSDSSPTSSPPAVAMPARPTITTPSTAAPAASDVSAPSPTPSRQPVIAAEKTEPAVRTNATPVAAAPRTPMKLSSLPNGTYNMLSTYGVSPTQLPDFQSQAIDAPPQIGIYERGTDHVVLIWREPKTPATKYMIETSYMVRNEETGLWIKVWRPLEPWTPAKSPGPGVLAAMIGGMEPETRYEMRVVGIDHEGKFSKPSDIVQVTTAEAYQAPMWIWISLALAVLLALIYKTHLNRQGDWQT